VACGEDGAAASVLQADIQASVLDTMRMVELSRRRGCFVVRCGKQWAGQ